jgi:hypothetical protein
VLCDEAYAYICGCNLTVLSTYTIICTGAIAEHVPYVRHAYGLCNEVVRLFGAGATINSNCAEVVAWARHMQVCAYYSYTVLYYKKYPFF